MTLPETDHGGRRPHDALLVGLVGGLGFGHGRAELVRDRDGRVVDVRLVDPDDMVGRPARSLSVGPGGRVVTGLVPDGAAGWIDGLARIAASGVPGRFEHEVAAAGRWFEVHARPLGGDRLAVVVGDITVRRHAETRLRASEDLQSFMLRLSDALGTLDDPEQIQRAAARALGVHLAVARAFYFAVERDGDGWVHVIEQDYMARPGMTSHAGRYPQTVRGRSPFAGLERGGTVVCDDTSALPAPGAPGRGAYPSGGMRAFIAVPLVERGGYVAGLCVLDSTPRRWTPAEVELTERTAERTRAAVERSRAETVVRVERERREAREREFVANAAHDLRTPLTGIAAALDALDAGAKDRPDDRELFLGHLRRESDRMTRLCESLLLLTRADASTDVPRRRLAVRGMLDHVAAGLEARPGVTVEIDASPAATVVSNAGLLERVVANLADNAAKYTSSGRIVLHASRDRGVVAIEVRDTGSGIRPEIAGRVFDRFFRDGDRSRDGFGLGLAIAARAAAALGATLTLVPAPEGGTVARLTLADDVA